MWCDLKNLGVLDSNELQKCLLKLYFANILLLCVFCTGSEQPGPESVSHTDLGATRSAVCKISYSSVQPRHFILCTLFDHFLDHR